MANTQPIPVREESSVISYAWVILAVVYLASIAAAYDQFKIPAIMPVLMETFQVDLTQAGLLMSSIAMIGLVLALVLMGQNFGQLFGPILFGEIVQRANWLTAGYMMIPFCLLGFTCSWMVKVR